jgi:hypothetical protein
MTWTSENSSSAGRSRGVSFSLQRKAETGICDASAATYRKAAEGGEPLLEGFNYLFIIKTNENAPAKVAQ